LLISTSEATDRRLVVGMMARIAVVLFALEAAIMQVLSGLDLSTHAVLEGLLDASLLTVSSTPVIYWWIVKPFVESTRAAQRTLAEELSAKAEQAKQLERALGQQTELLAANEELRVRLQRANQEVAQSNERVLQRIGADLHDGPAQLLAYALLRFDAVSRAVGGAALPPKQAADVVGLRSAIADTLKEVRHISAGLAPPNIENATMQEAIDVAIAAHEQHTGTRVLRTIGVMPTSGALPLRICVYRFVQEALSNAYQHAGGRGQAVSCQVSDLTTLHVAVRDEGPGFDPLQATGRGLGLAGMRARIEAIGGTLDIQSKPDDGGSLLIANFYLSSLEPAP
jgi:signal transduction histidine kinase